MWNELELLIKRYPALAPVRGDILAAYRLLEGCFAAGGKLLLCGNGGSAADSEHIAGELLKAFKLERKIPRTLDFTGADEQETAFFYDNLQGGLPAISLAGHPAYATAWCNDANSELVFAQQVYALAQPGDCLLALSTSGNSKNVVHAVLTARAKGISTIGLTGEGGGRLAALCDACICVPAQETFQVQEYHLPVYHTLCAMLEQRFFGKEALP